MINPPYDGLINKENVQAFYSLFVVFACPKYPRALSVQPSNKEFV